MPSAGPEELLLRTLPALRSAADRAGVRAERVVIVDERPDRDGTTALLDRLGFRRVVTGGIGNGPARNRGASIGESPWLLFIDDDVELDEGAVRHALHVGREEIQRGAAAVIGGLRPPPGAPAWLRWAYKDTTINPASALAAPGRLRPVGMAVTVLLIRRDTFGAAGGFPEERSWGWIDALFGLRLERTLGPDAFVIRDPAIAGIHRYEPTWGEWLERMEKAGRRLAEVCARLDGEDRRRLLEAVSLADQPRHRIKRALGHLPRWATRGARGRLARRASGAAALARGFRQAHMEPSS